MMMKDANEQRITQAAESELRQTRDAQDRLRPETRYVAEDTTPAKCPSCGGEIGDILEHARTCRYLRADVCS